MERFCLERSSLNDECACFRDGESERVPGDNLLDLRDGDDVEYLLDRGDEDRDPLSDTEDVESRLLGDTGVGDRLPLNSGGVSGLTGSNSRDDRGMGTGLAS